MAFIQNRLINSNRLLTFVSDVTYVIPSGSHYYSLMIGDEYLPYECERTYIERTGFNYYNQAHTLEIGSHITIAYNSENFYELGILRTGEWSYRLCLWQHGVLTHQFTQYDFSGHQTVNGLYIAAYTDDEKQLGQLFYCYSESDPSYAGVITWTQQINITDEDVGPNVIFTLLNGIVSDDEDPYAPGGNSGTGGGLGDFDGTSDEVDIPSLPTVSAVDTGFISLFTPTLTQLNSLASYMWSDLFDVDGWKKLFANPMDAILGLSIVPVSVPTSGLAPVVVGNISTGINVNRAESQYVEVDCGTINVNEYWGSYLDYSPYTKAEIYLPYVGTHQLDIDDIMAKPVHVVYHIDILSGACNAYVKCGGSVLYTFTGQCASSIPITGDNFTNVINGVLSIAASIGTMVSSGGLYGGAVSNAAGAVAQMKPIVEKSGSMSGTGGMLAVQTPYIILTRPAQCVAKEQNKYTGYPSHVTTKLSDLTGFTIVEEIHLENINATDSEKSEIMSILRSGVIV